MLIPRTSRALEYVRKELVSTWPAQGFILPAGETSSAVSHGCDSILKNKPAGKVAWFRLKVPGEEKNNGTIFHW